MEHPPLPIILAGGLGTRVQGVLGDVPKVLAPIHGRPFITRLIQQLLDAGCGECVLATGFKSSDVIRAAREAFPSLPIHVSVEQELLGTGGAIRLAAESVPPRSTYIVLNGDSYCGANLTEFIDIHRSRRAAASIVAAYVPDTARYGALEIDEDDHIIAFHEKQRSGGAGWMNAGIYALERSVIDAIPMSQVVSVERDVFPKLCGGGLYAFRAPEARFIDIGTPESLAAAQTFFAE